MYGNYPGAIGQADPVATVGQRALGTGVANADPEIVLRLAPDELQHLVFSSRLMFNPATGCTRIYGPDRDAQTELDIAAALADLSVGSSRSSDVSSPASVASTPNLESPAISVAPSAPVSAAPSTGTITPVLSTLSERPLAAPGTPVASGSPLAAPGGVLPADGITPPVSGGLGLGGLCVPDGPLEPSVSDGAWADSRGARPEVPSATYEPKALLLAPVRDMIYSGTPEQVAKSADQLQDQYPALKELFAYEDQEEPVPHALRRTQGRQGTLVLRTVAFSLPAQKAPSARPAPKEAEPHCPACEKAAGWDDTDGTFYCKVPTTPRCSHGYQPRELLWRLPTRSWVQAPRRELTREQILAHWKKYST